MQVGSGRLVASSWGVKEEIYNANRDSKPIDIIYICEMNTSCNKVVDKRE